MKLCSEGQLLAIGTALLESLVNAIDHGNLELDPELKRGDDVAIYDGLKRERMEQSPYQDRKVCINASLTHSHATFVIRDEGPGFDSSTIADPNDSDSLMSDCGRGLLLIQMFMDEVIFNERGNEITLRLYFDDVGA